MVVIIVELVIRLVINMIIQNRNKLRRNKIRKRIDAFKEEMETFHVKFSTRCTKMDEKERKGKK